MADNFCAFLNDDSYLSLLGIYFGEEFRIPQAIFLLSLTSHLYHQTSLLCVLVLRRRAFCSSMWMPWMGSSCKNRNRIYLMPFYCSFELHIPPDIVTREFRKAVCLLHDVRMEVQLNISSPQWFAICFLSQNSSVFQQDLGKNFNIYHYSYYAFCNASYSYEFWKFRLSPEWTEVLEKVAEASFTLLQWPQQLCSYVSMVAALHCPKP